jgi:hypothetical protein
MTFNGNKAARSGLDARHRRFCQKALKSLSSAQQFLLDKT